MTNGLTDDAVLAYAAQISDLEDDREAVQTDLKTAWGHIREAHGKRFADSLKLAVKRARMKSEQRQQASEIDAEADRIVALIQAGPRVRVARGAREAIPDHNPETGEIIEIGSDERAVTGIGPESTANAGRSVPEDARDVASTVIPGSHIPAQPNGADPRTPVDAATVGETADHSEPAEVPPPPSSAAPGDGSAVIPSAAPVVAKPDMTKPNPWCMDPDECGVEASWNCTCLKCQAVKAGREAAGARLQ